MASILIQNGTILDPSQKLQRKADLLLRNGRGATAICAYSLRAREGAPVSLPVPWEALNPRRDLRGERFNLHNVNEHLQWSLAAWADYDKRRATLTLASLRALSGRTEAAASGSGR